MHELWASKKKSDLVLHIAVNESRILCCVKRHHKSTHKYLLYRRIRKTMDIIRAIEQQQINPDVADFNVGDNVKVHYRIKEGNRERIQVFQGDVIRRHGASNRETFTVRKISFSVGVERTFPVHSPKIEKIEVVRRGDVNRARLYYLRDKVGKAAKIKEKAF